MQIVRLVRLVFVYLFIHLFIYSLLDIWFAQ